MFVCKPNRVMSRIGCILRWEAQIFEKKLTGFHVILASGLSKPVVIPV